MAIETVKLFDPQLLTDTVLTFYTAPALSKTIIRKISFYNISTGVVEVCLHLVPSGDIESNSNLILKRKLGSFESYDFIGAVNDVLEAGDTIRANASVVDSVNIRASGAVIVNG